MNKNVLFADLDYIFKKMDIEIDKSILSENLDTQMDSKDFNEVNNTIITEFRKFGIGSYILNFISGTKDNSGKFIVDIFAVLNIPGKSPIHREMKMQLNGTDRNDLKINSIYSNSVNNSTAFLPSFEDVSMIKDGVSYENINQ